MSQSAFLSHPSFYLKFNSVSPLLPPVSCGQLLKEAIAAKSTFGELIQPFFEKRMTGRWATLSTCGHREGLQTRHGCGLFS